MRQTRLEKKYAITTLGRAPLESGWWTCRRIVGPRERISIPYSVGGVKRHPVNARTLLKVGHLYRDGHTLCQAQNAMVPDKTANHPAGEI